MMITVISRNIDKVLGFPDIVLIGYSLHSLKSNFFLVSSFLISR